MAPHNRHDLNCAVNLQLIKTSGINDHFDRCFFFFYKFGIVFYTNCVAYRYCKF